MIEFIWDGVFSLWRAFVVITIFGAIGAAIAAVWEKFAHPKKDRRDWRDDFR
jgi:LPS O-antigen subunit length determinant protein (WzzB/FepE family)